MLQDSLISQIPLIVITGPTASGKSGLAIKLAKKWGGEIICADSRTIYKGMDIATAKPTQSEQKTVRHWMLDVVSPGEPYSVYDFQQQVFRIIDDIRSRGKIPLLVGGSGLYIDSVILDFKLGPGVNTELRNKLTLLSTDELRTMILAQQLPLPENQNNRRYLIRCIEKNNTITSRKMQPDTSTYVVALNIDRDVLRQHISQRIQLMFESGLVQETQQMLGMYHENSQAMTSNAYEIVAQLLQNEIDEDTAKQKLVTRDLRLAKRQITWLRRHDFVTWLPVEAAEQYFDTILDNFSKITRDSVQ